MYDSNSEVRFKTQLGLIRTGKVLAWMLSQPCLQRKEAKWAEDMGLDRSTRAVPGQPTPVRTAAAKLELVGQRSPLVRRDERTQSGGQ